MGAFKKLRYGLDVVNKFTRIDGWYYKNIKEGYRNRNSKEPTLGNIFENTKQGGTDLIEHWKEKWERAENESGPPPE